MLISFISVYLIAIVSNSLAHPSLIIKTGAHSDENKQEHHNQNNHGVVFKTGTSGTNSESGYDKDNENKHLHAEDVEKYAQENSDKKHHLDQSDSSDQKFSHEHGGSVEDYGNKLAHKKGHHNSGYHNSYHKDESGSNSSYYDDSDDEGGEYVHNSRQGAFGGKTSHNNRNSHLDGHYDSKQNAKHGGHDKGGTYEKSHGDARNYDRDNYYDNYQNQGNVNAGNHHGSSGGYSEEEYYEHQPQYYQKPHHYYKRQRYERPYYYEKPQYYDRSHYYEPVPRYDNYYPEKKTITVYEDPRVYEEGLDYKPNPVSYNQRNYNGDSIELNIQPPLRSTNDYYSEKPVYDNYYY